MSGYGSIAGYGQSGVPYGMKPVPVLDPSQVTWQNTPFGPVVGDFSTAGAGMMSTAAPAVPQFTPPGQPVVPVTASAIAGYGGSGGTVVIPATNPGSGMTSRAVPPGGSASPSGAPGGSTGGGNGKIDEGKLGWNSQTIRLGLDGFQALSNLYLGLGQLNLAKKSYQSQKDFAETNLSNQIRSYNTQLNDRIASRAVMTGMSDADRDAYIKANSASRSSGK